MSIINKLRIIAKSKFSDKTKLGNWYQERLNICSLCPHNSDNKKVLSLKEKSIVAVNLGKAACLGCGCEIAAKASVREEECGLSKLGEVPIWGKLPEIKTHRLRYFDIQNLSADIIDIIPGKVNILNYGDIKYKSNTDVAFSIEGKDSPISDIKLSVGCGCTSAISESRNGVHTIKVSYDSTRLGEFNKLLIVSCTQFGSRKKLSFRLRGNVTK